MWNTITVGVMNFRMNSHLPYLLPLRFPPAAAFLSDSGFCFFAAFSMKAAKGVPRCADAIPRPSAFFLLDAAGGSVNAFARSPPFLLTAEGAAAGVDGTAPLTL